MLILHQIACTKAARARGEEVELAMGAMGAKRVAHSENGLDRRVKRRRE